MRIISGAYGGRMLKTPPSNARFRPTTDRVRESLFNILVHNYGFAGKRVLDLFAGTGALAIEALSRGAESAVLVERNRKHARIIEDNIAALQIQSAASVHVLTAEAFIKSSRDGFDIIFCDPPYDYPDMNALLATISASSLLEKGGVMCFEHSGKESVSPPEHWQILQTKQFGTTAITLMEARNE